MKQKKIGAVILLFICLFVIYFNQGMLFTNSMADIVIENVVYAAKDRQGNLLVLDGSGGRLLKADSSGTVQWTLESGRDGFSEAKRVVSAENGHVFIQDIEKEGSGYRICKERILEYSDEGKLIGEAVVHEYETAILAPHIIGMVPTEDGVFYIYKQDNEKTWA